jgi:translation initiation factor IF-2
VSGLNDAALAFTASRQAASDAAAGQLAPSVEPQKKAPAGPRVLGKIDLPQPRVMPAASRGAETGKAFTVKPVSDRREDEEEADRPKGAAAKKKGRKREISRFDLIDYEGREPRRSSPRHGGKRRDSDPERQAQLEASRPKASKRVVKIDEFLTVGDLAKQMSLKAGEVIAKLMQLGIMATINQAIDADTATIIAEEFEYQVERTNFVESDILVDSTPDDAGQVAPRAPVVTVMGHVDHGKTSLLDAIRVTTVAAREHGGITQHIGAYQVPVEGKGTVTFIDTPGHAAFTSMRARGAKVTDIVVLVVAADDGVMPQTVEAISHAKAAQVPIIVAVNKIDKPDANPDRIRQQLAEHGLSPEDWGGDTMYYRVSALKKEGLKELLEGILLLAELKELSANPTRRARGTIIESRQDKGRGTVATVLVQNGTLNVGDVFVAGAEYGRIRSMSNDLGERIDAAGPSAPVEITGFTGSPEAGDDFFVVESEAKAREVSDQRGQKKTLKDLRSASGPISLEEFSRRANSVEALELNVILKADVHGSLEAVKDAIEKLSTEKVKVRVLHSAVGGITESDVQLAVASKAIIIGFGVRAEVRAQAEAENIGIDLRFYRIIYELLDDVRKAMAGLLAPIREETRTGRVEVRETFNVPKMGTVAGCYVLDGTIKRGAFVRLLRDSKVVHEGKMSSLRRFKDDVKEVQSGYECGVMLENYNDVKPGDQFEVFEIKEVAATLD